MGLHVIMLLIMSHGADSGNSEEIGHAARLNKEADTGAELAAGLEPTVNWDEDIDWPQVLVLVAMASAPKVMKDWRHTPNEGQQRDRGDMPWGFDLPT